MELDRPEDTHYGNLTTTMGKVEPAGNGGRDDVGSDLSIAHESGESSNIWGGRGKVGRRVFTPSGGREKRKNETSRNALTFHGNHRGRGKVASLGTTRKKEVNTDSVWAETPRWGGWGREKATG